MIIQYFMIIFCCNDIKKLPYNNRFVINIFPNSIANHVFLKLKIPPGRVFQLLTINGLLILIYCAVVPLIIFSAHLILDAANGKSVCAAEGVYESVATEEVQVFSVRTMHIS